AVAAAAELSGELPTGRPVPLVGPRPPFVSVASPSRASEPAVVAAVEPQADSSDAASSRPGANRAPRGLMCPFRLECRSWWPAGIPIAWSGRTRPHPVLGAHLRSEPGHFGRRWTPTRRTTHGRRRVRRAPLVTG